MGSSAQKCSSVHWCRPRVRFNRVPEKVPDGDGSGEGLGSFGAEPGQAQQGSEKVWEGVLVPDFVWEALVQGSSFGAEPGQVQQEKVWEALVQLGQVQQNREAWTSAHLSYVVAVQMQCWR